MKQVRQEKIIELLTKNKNLSTEELADYFNVSTQTIRRDLDSLEEQGIVNKMYGGATIIGGAEEKEEETFASFFDKDVENHLEKTRIAEAAAALIEDRSTVSLDVGTTVRALAPHLNDKNDLIIITRDLATAAILAGHPTNQVYLIGGFIDANYESSPTYLQEFLNSISTIDVFVFGSAGITVNEGFTSSVSNIKDYRSLVMSKSAKIIAMGDYSKFGRTFFYHTCDLTEVDHIITDSGAPKDIVQEIRDLGVDIITV